jgi:5,10-methylenetetrahydromethanopterin reductase
VCNFVTRHPSVLAAQAAYLQLASGGRAIVGVAKGDSAVGMIGRKPQKHDEFVADARLLRDYLNLGTASTGGYQTQLGWLAGTGYRPVPIEMACAGPRSLRAAAALADRIQLTVGAPPERIRWAVDVIEEGLAAAGRRRSDVKIGALVPLIVDTDRAAAAEKLRTGVAVIAHMASLPGMDLSTQPERLRRVTARLRDAYSYDHHHMEQVNPMRDLVDAEFAAWYGIGGPPGYVAERMAQMVELGIDYFFLGSIPRADRETLAAKVMPQIRKLSPGR